jgi:tetratricopeptide (TPR) repeat protein
MEDYRPGDALSDFVAVFVPVNSNGFQVNSHVEKLAESTCKHAAGDKLWCGTCHDPHSTPAASERAAWYRMKCLACHETSRCNRGFDCATCHMPKNRAADANHGVFTDHSIPRIPGGVRNQSAASWRLRGFGPTDKGDRELGLAYAEIGVRTGNANQQAEAIRLLTGKGDPEAQVRLADLEERAGNSKQAMALYQSALRDDPNSVVAMVNLGRLYGSSGLLDEAIRLWRAALERNPCLAEAGANLQIALRAKHDSEGAGIAGRSQRFCSF